MTTIDKNAEKFAELMIEKIESLEANWKKPWFSKVKNSSNFLPQNITGRTYAGGNAILLFFLCEKFNYQTPVFLTFSQARKEGVKILKGSKYFPVYYSIFTCCNIETGRKISLDQYKELTEEEKKAYNIYVKNKYYPVFNLDQTNFAEKHPDKWEILKEKFSPEEEEKEDKTSLMYSNVVLDDMVSNQKWVCKITLKQGDRAFFTPTFDSIELPLKKQFETGESFYSTMLHEMAHSTGTETRLNRRAFKDHSKDSYGREELVAELTAALTGMFMGISSGVREENAAYLKSWCATIKKEPKFLITVLTNSMKATKYITEKLNVSLNICETEKAA